MKDEMDVEGKGNGEDGDLTHPIGSTIPGLERWGKGSEERGPQ